jgi:hypothetical protein
MDKLLCCSFLHLVAALEVGSCNETRAVRIAKKFSTCNILCCRPVLFRIEITLCSWCSSAKEPVFGSTHGASVSCNTSSGVAGNRKVIKVENHGIFQADNKSDIFTTPPTSHVGELPHYLTLTLLIHFKLESPIPNHRRYSPTEAILTINGKQPMPPRSSLSPRRQHHKKS